jgi:hypothetical protein
VRRVLAFAFSVVAVAVASVARAETKLELGARTGYALRFGNVSAGEASAVVNGDMAQSQVPLWFDLGARAGPHAFLGVYLQYGVVVLDDEFVEACDELDRTQHERGGYASCQVHDLRLGAEFHYHFVPRGRSLDPWVGAGFGYEWLSAGLFAYGDTGSGDYGLTLHGFEFVNLQAGLDVAAAGTMTVGPFVAFSMGAYERLSRSCIGELCTEADATDRLRDAALHQWLFFGIRAEFVP